jgi:CBS-domain-containing membrane protein
MTEKTPEICQRPIEITNEDLQAALRDMHTYVDVSIDDLKALCTMAAQHAEERTLQTIPVKDIMTTKVISIDPEAGIHDISKCLADNKISGLPVVDRECRLIGMVSEADILEMTGIGRDHKIRDLIKHLMGEPFHPNRFDAIVKDFMSTPAITIHPDADIRRAAKIMNERRVKRLPVIDNQGKLIGIISRGDIVRAVGNQ